MKRTNPQTEQQVLAQILLGYPYADIAADTGVAVSTIKKIRARNKERYEADSAELKNWSLEYAKTIKNRTFALLMRRLDESGDELSFNQLIRLVNLADRLAARERASDRPKPFTRQQDELDNLLALADKK